MGSIVVNEKTPDMTDTRSPRNLAEGLQAAFAAESMSAQRYASFARTAEIEGLVDVARVFSELAESAACAAQGHLDMLGYVDPATGLPIGDSGLNLASAVAAALKESSGTYPDLAAAAHGEGVADTASWLETMAALKKWHVTRLNEALGALSPEAGRTDAPHPAPTDAARGSDAEPTEVTR